MITLIVYLFLNLISSSYPSEDIDYEIYEEEPEYIVIDNLYLKHPLYFAEVIVNPYEELYDQEEYYYYDY